jgi:hypothetical protein
MLDIAVAQVRLQGSGALIGERKAASVPQHVRVGLEAELGLDASPLDHAREPRGAKGAARSEVNTNRDFGYFSGYIGVSRTTFSTLASSTVSLDKCSSAATCTAVI